ncbi:hypothetical protein AC578_9790 [Pseudocercospora eumusae]|uniref:Uncharacterized protein n=1 Tax=Pseudocercospora eumusae TaxID=321146 RepID=A0A139H517_9PEZI|nr:hypothetical protein AC578_9790 [Pseudocercospora eumusae]
MARINNPVSGRWLLETTVISKHNQFDFASPLRYLSLYHRMEGEKSSWGQETSNEERDLVHHIRLKLEAGA